jgi:uncharacterized membrane protein
MEAEMELDLSNALDLYAALRGQVIDLWVWFVAGNFAAVAAFFSVDRMMKHIKVLFLLGFWVYAIGNLLLIFDNLRVLDALVADIKLYVDKWPNHTDYKTSLTVLTGIQHPIYVPVIFHLLVDLCVTSIVLLQQRTSEPMK